MSDSSIVLFPSPNHVCVCESRETVVWRHEVEPFLATLLSPPPVHPPGQLLIKRRFILRQTRVTTDNE